MAKLNPRVFLAIENTSELEAIKHALEVQIDIESDMVFEDLPTSVNEVRKLASLNDDNMQTALRECIRKADERMTRLEASQDLLLQLEQYIR